MPCSKSLFSVLLVLVLGSDRNPKHPEKSDLDPKSTKCGQKLCKDMSCFILCAARLMLYLGRILISIIAGLKVQLKEEVLEDSADIIEMEVQDPLG